MRANNSGCLWRSDLGGGAGECDTEAFFSCEMNHALQFDQDACIAAGCAWIGNQFGPGFEGNFFNSCVSPCFNASITDKTSCEAANGSNFVAGTCVWQTGFCEPKNFIGGCPDNDGDITACTANTNCRWFETSFGTLRDLNGTTDFNNYLHPPDRNWIAIGLQQPSGGVGTKNQSIYNLSKIDGTAFVWLFMAKENASSRDTLGENISRLYCNSTIIMEYNWTNDASSPNCKKGTCNAYNKTFSCGGSTVHYFLNNITKELEVLWEVSTSILNLDTTEINNIVTDIINKTTVKINGNLTEHVRENSTALDGSNATRVRTSAGFCNDALLNSFFAGMDNEPPIIIATDSISDMSTTNPNTPSDHDYLEIYGLGVKKTPDAYAYGIHVKNINGSALCNSIPVGGNAFGSGKNTSRYYLYLDTDGVSTGGCSADNANSVVGFEYRFKYVAEIGSNGKLIETSLTQQCLGGNWTASNVPFKSERNKACDFVNGPIFAIDKSTFTGKSNVNTDKSWRAYATTAHSSGNSSNISDAVGPGSTDFKGIDVEIVDCMSTADKDKPQCTKFKQFGFFPGEFGPACLDGKDNDGDSSTDCNDFDCKYDPFFCSGSFTSLADDKTAPSIVWNKVNQKIPTALTFIFDTNEPANGTVRFYNNDSGCSNLNSTLRDEALDTADTHDDYRPHHVADTSGLSANKTYYYKLEVCDPSSNCAVSKCNNATTAVSHTNITFKLDIPSTWSVDIPSINLTNYSQTYALKASTQYLDNINITVRNKDNTSYITFVGVDIFEKQTFNVSQFVTGATFVGIDANQYQNFKQRTGMDRAVVKIPSTGDIAQHCDDDGANCKDVTSKVSCTFETTFTECTVIDAVGLGFSSYKASSSSTGGTGGGTSSGSGGGGAAGSGVAATTMEGTSKTQFWDSIAAGASVSMGIHKAEIPISKLTFTVRKAVSNIEIRVEVLLEAPATEVALQTPVYKYIHIKKENLKDEDYDNVEIEFKVLKSWLTNNGIAEDDVVLYRYNDNKWNLLQTMKVGSEVDSLIYKSTTPGFSYFAIGSKTAPVAAEMPKEIPEEVQIPTGEAVEIQPEPVIPLEEPISKMTMGWIVAGIIAIVAVIGYFIWKRKTEY